MHPDVESAGGGSEGGGVDWGIVAPAFLFPALGGTLFGYDIGASGGALISLTSEATAGTDWWAATQPQFFFHTVRRRLYFPTRLDCHTCILASRSQCSSRHGFKIEGTLILALVL